MGGIRHAADSQMEPYVDIRGQGIITAQSGESLIIENIYNIMHCFVYYVIYVYARYQKHVI